MHAQPLAHAEPRRLTRREYDRLGELGFFEGERVELIHGIVVRMSPIGPPHSELLDRLTEVFVPALVGQARVRIQQPFCAWDESEPEPDVAIVPKGTYDKEHPKQALLIIEVAQSSLEYDRETKGPLYAASGVPEYWIVDVAARAIEVHTDAVDGRYASIARVAEGGSVRPAAFPHIEVRASDLLA